MSGVDYHLMQVQRILFVQNDHTTGAKKTFSFFLSIRHNPVGLVWSILRATEYYIAH